MSVTSVIKLLLLLVTALLGLVVVYYALIFGGSLPDHPALRGKNDLVLHVAAFFALSVPLLLLGSWKWKVAALVAFAGLIEIVQAFQPRRNAEWEDFAASVAGVCLGMLVAFLLRRIGALIMPSKGSKNE
ncbi:MAG: VanZ family protein [Erythrobacter sp.]